MNCDKYVKKAKVGVLLLLLMFIPLIFKDIFVEKTLYEIFTVVFMGFTWFKGLQYVLPYIKCIVDYNQSHKPPY